MRSKVGGEYKVDNLNLDVFDSLEKDVAFDILVKFLEEISVETERLKDMALEYGVQQIADAFKEATEKKKAIKDKIFKLYESE